MAGEGVSGKKNICLYAMLCAASGMISKKLRLLELEAQVVVNIHHGLELKHSQFLSVSACSEFQIPAVF